MSDPKRHKGTKTAKLKELAEECGLSTRTLERYEADGVSIDDAEAIRAHRQSLMRSDEESDSPDLTAARIRKIDLECDRLALKLDEERKALVPRSAVLTWLTQVQAKVEEALDTVVTEAPNWVGLTPVKAQAKAQEIKKRLTAEFHAAPRKL